MNSRLKSQDFFLAYQKLNLSYEKWKMFSDKLVNNLCWPKTGIQFCLIIFVGWLCKKHPIISHFVIACVWQELQKSWSKVCTCTLWWNNFCRSILNCILNFVSMVMPSIFTLKSRVYCSFHCICQKLMSADVFVIVII